MLFWALFGHFWVFSVGWAVYTLPPYRSRVKSLVCSRVNRSILMEDQLKFKNFHSIEISDRSLDRLLNRRYSIWFFRFSMSRLNAYKALASPSLIALTSKDPILTAFKLSNQLKSLSKMESQFCKEYTVLREAFQKTVCSWTTNKNNEDTVGAK